LTDPKLDEFSERLQSALSHADMGGRLPHGTRFSWLKQGFLRLSRVFAADQVRYNHQVLEILRSIDAQVTRLIRAEGQLQGRLDKTERERDIDRSELRMLQSRLERLASGAATGRPPRTLSAPVAHDTSESDALTNNDFAGFYRAFEDNFRGSPAAIRKRQEAAYLRDFLPLAGSKAAVLDIGCGRGEWLSLLRDNGVRASGVDLNEEFVGLCREAELDVRAGDGIGYLASLPDEMLAGVTAFHVAEHLEMADLFRLLDRAHRVLIPGGLLVLETPNPTNITVGAANFWADLTHLKPLHPHTLAFLVGHRGFTDVDLRFLHPTPAPNFIPPEEGGAGPAELRRVVEHLNIWFFGPEDYAIVARKPGGLPSSETGRDLTE
jgi:O-antigen chain-terminating methyltransferase